MRSIPRKVTNEPQTADRCRIQAVTEVACEFIADYVVPQMIIRSPRVRPGKFVLVNTKRLLQQYPPNSRHLLSPSACLKGANNGSRCPHSITSSARASSEGGIVTPSAFAVFKLTASKKLVGNSIGKSPGAVPRRILATKYAA